MNDLLKYAHVRIATLRCSERGGSGVGVGLLVAVAAIAGVAATAIPGGSIADIFQNAATSIEK